MTRVDPTLPSGLSASASEEPTRDLGLSELLDFAVHDLKQPITAARVLLDCLEHEAEPSRDVRDLVEGLREAVLAIANQVEELGHLSERPDSPLPDRVFDLSLMVRKAALGHRVQLEAAGIRIHPPSGPVRVLGDKALLYRVIGNLLSNALRHARGARNLTFEATERAGWVWLVVRDDGCGWTGDGPSRPGGRGLRFCEWAVARLGGRFAVGNGQNGGEFTLCLRSGHGVGGLVVRSV